MKAVGEMLREERKRQGMSIEDIMSLTKVSRRHIEALEDGNIRDLPHPVYVKGFLKVYAELLGLEYKKLLPAVDDAYASLGLDTFENEPHARPSENISLNPPQRSGFFFRILMVLLVLALLGGAGYYGYNYFFAENAGSPRDSAVSNQESAASPGGTVVTESTTTVSSETITVGEEPISDAAPVVQESVTSSGVEAASEDALPETPQDGSSETTPEESASQEGETQPASETSADESAVSELAGAVVQEADTSSENTTGEPAAEPASPNIVIIPETARQAPSSKIKVLQVIATGQCWIEAKVDAELTTDFYVRKGERVDIKFQENLAVKFGNIGEVSLRYNGKPYTTSVPANGVKTLVFPPAGS